ncbi:Yip1 family protein [Ilumatobacter sp.]|uniref:Yip1 family protein n=1 Tax=Ilumatobacter sp. TaxID=1967498 RepID=UPI003AF5C481
MSHDRAETSLSQGDDSRTTASEQPPGTGDKTKKSTRLADEMLTQPFVFFASILAACLLLLIAARLEGVLSWRFGLELLLVGGAAYVLWVIFMRPEKIPSSWKNVQRRFGQAIEAHKSATDRDDLELSDGQSLLSPEDQYWYLPIAFFSTVASVTLVVLAVKQTWDLTTEQLTPWLLGLGAVAFGILALMAISYAPPGPNWVKRLSGVDGRILLVMIGLAIVAFGTLKYFDFGPTGVAPSDWWLALVGLGLVITLAGASKPRRHDGNTRQRFRGGPVASEAVRHADRAVELAARAQAYKHKTELISGPSSASGDPDSPLTVAERAAQSAQARADEAQRQATHAMELQEGVASKVGEAKQGADAAAKATADARHAHLQAEVAWRTARSEEDSA